MKLKIKATHVCMYVAVCNQSCRHRELHRHYDWCDRECTYGGVTRDAPICYPATEDRELTFVERYKEYNKDGANFGTLWWVYYTFIEFYWQATRSTFSAITSASRIGFKGPINIISDGYWLVFLSPFAIALIMLIGLVINDGQRFGVISGTDNQINSVLVKHLDGHERWALATYNITEVRNGYLTRDDVIGDMNFSQWHLP